MSSTFTDNQICELSALDLAKHIAKRDLTVSTVVKASLARIERVQAELNAFTCVLSDEALAQAAKADAQLKKGKPLGQLFGVPFAAKDFTPTKGHLTTRGSHAYANTMGDYDPVYVQRLRAAGAILIAKTTTPEFAFSSFTASPLWGKTANPWNPQRSSGGSSGGSAVAVATGCVPLAEGTDMGGSVRIPAAWCGVVGLKPSLGRIPMDIIDNCFDSISHFGPLARHIDDCHAFLQVTQGPAASDIQSQPNPDPLPVDYLQNDDLNGLRIALSSDLGFYNVQQSVLYNLEHSAAILRTAGAKVDVIELPWQAKIFDAWNSYWGVFLAAAQGHCLADYRQQMDPELVTVMEQGLAMDAVSFKAIEQIRSEQWQQLAAVFSNYDALICPTMTCGAVSIDHDDSHYGQRDEHGRINGLDMTSPFNNIPQCPALSVPSGFDDDGLPTAVQIVGKRFDDGLTLRLGRVIEYAHRAAPKAITRYRH